MLEGFSLSCRVTAVPWVGEDSGPLGLSWQFTASDVLLWGAVGGGTLLFQGMFGTVGWASPHNPKIQGSSPSFVTSAGPTPLSPQRYQRWRRSCAAVVMVGPDGSFLAREILAGCYKQRI